MTTAPSLPPREQVLRDLHDAWSAERARRDASKGSRGPRYLQLAGVVEAAMEDGRIVPGSRLPPERILAQTLGVSRGTVVSAYDVLRDKGFAVGRRGSGTWVREDLAFASRFGTAGARNRNSGHESISFSMANLPALRPVLDSVLSLSVADLEHPLSSHGYHPLGLPELREVIARYYTEQGLPTTVDQLLVTTGAQQAIWLVAAHLIEQGDSAVVEDPTYYGAINALRAAGAGAIPVAITEAGMDVDALRRIVARVRPRFIYVIPVHNPTGIVSSDEATNELVEIASTAGATIVEDRTLSQITFDCEAPPPIATRLPVEQAIVVESLSKIFWGGLRVGWVRASSHLIDQLAKEKATADLASPVLSQIVAARLLRQVDPMRQLVTTHLSHRLDHMARLLTELLPTWEWSRPAGGLSLWARIPRGAAAHFLQHAAQYGVTAVPGAAMSAGGRFTDYLRLAYVLDPVEMEEGIQRLATTWRSFESIARETPSFAVVV